MSIFWDRRRRTGHSKHLLVNYQTLAEKFVRWKTEKQLSVYDASSLWGKVCEEVNWPNTQRSRVYLRTIWTTNRGNIIDWSVDVTEHYKQTDSKNCGPLVCWVRFFNKLI